MGASGPSMFHTMKAMSKYRNAMISVGLCPDCQKVLSVTGLRSSARERLGLDEGAPRRLPSRAGGAKDGRNAE